jgi:hypothetical protein
MKNMDDCKLWTETFVATRWQNSYCYIDIGTGPWQNSDFTLMQIRSWETVAFTNATNLLPTAAYHTYHLHEQSSLPVGKCCRRNQLHRYIHVSSFSLSLTNSGLTDKCSHLEANFPDNSFIDKILQRFFWITLSQYLPPWPFFRIVW